MIYFDSLVSADNNLLKVPEGLRDEQVIFLSDILPTGWHANELARVGEGDNVAIWGAGPGMPLSDGHQHKGLQYTTGKFWRLILSCLAT